jgi:hypothetical protein
VALLEEDVFIMRVSRQQASVLQLGPEDQAAAWIGNGPHEPLEDHCLEGSERVPCGDCAKGADQASEQVTNLNRGDVLVVIKMEVKAPRLSRLGNIAMSNPALSEDEKTLIHTVFE